jgi:hypothetical protein
MQQENLRREWQQTQGNKRANWSILNPNDPNKTNENYSPLATLLNARYQAGDELATVKFNQKPEDLSIKEVNYGTQGSQQAQETNTES